MTVTPRVSFVVPCYNYGRYLPDCLASIFCQQCEGDYEVILVDDASTDNTPDILKAIEDPRARIVTHTRNQGHVATVNEGLALARGEFIARIDPDDRYRPGFLATVLPIFVQYPEVGLIYGDAALINDRGEEGAPRSDVVHGGKDFRGNEFFLLLERNVICAPTTIARRQAWLEAMPIPKGLAFNDWYFNLMMARRWDFYYVNRVLADYRVHSQNHHSKIVTDKSEESSIFALMNRVFAEREWRDDLEAGKRRIEKTVYATQYVTLADKYFGANMNSDARRCYWNAVKRRPSWLLRGGLLRRFSASIAGRAYYDFGKSLIRATFANR